MEVNTLRVVTLNIHGWRDKNEKLSRLRILACLKNIDADIIALQEVKRPFPCSSQLLSAYEAGFQTAQR